MEQFTSIYVQQIKYVEVLFSSCPNFGLCSCSNRKQLQTAQFVQGTATNHHKYGKLLIRFGSVIADGVTLLSFRHLNKYYK